MTAFISTDNRTCADTYFLCDTNKCVPCEFVSDGFPDCEDETDESQTTSCTLPPTTWLEWLLSESRFSVIVRQCRPVTDLCCVVRQFLIICVLFMVMFHLSLFMTNLRLCCLLTHAERILLIITLDMEDKKYKRNVKIPVERTIFCSATYNIDLMDLHCCSVTWHLA